jgi:uncharacterized protein (DUF885 family)
MPETTMRLRPVPTAIPLSIALALLISTAACQKHETPASTATPAATQASTAEADAKFADVSKRWLDGWLEQQPVSATQTGKHDFDDRIEDLSAAGRQKFTDFSKQMLAEVDALDAASSRARTRSTSPSCATRSATTSGRWTRCRAGHGIRRSTTASPAARCTR